VSSIKYINRLDELITVVSYAKNLLKCIYLDGGVVVSFGSSLMISEETFGRT
jgi:hypothetical protein